MNEIIEFARFSHQCMSVRKEGKMYFLFPLPEKFQGQWLILEELYEKYIEFKDDADFIQNLEQIKNFN